jgi:adenylate cyclase
VPASPLALAPLPADAKPVLIVLPFANISDDSQQEYFSDGITEDITTALARIPGFLVMARNTAFTFKGKAVNAQAIGRELGVRYMLEGSVRKAGDRLRLNAQLIETATGNHVWAERYDRPMADVFIVQDELADRIVGTVAAHLRRREGDKAVVASLEKIQAYELTVRARRLFSVGDRDNVLEARRLVMLALERDPTYSLAHAWLVRSLLAVHNNRWNEEFNQPATLAKLVEASSKAVAIDPNEPLNRAANALGILVSGRRDEAVGEAERAIALGQNDADVLSQAAVVLSNAGRHERAIELVSFAHQLDPFIPPQMIGNVLGVAMYQLGRYSEAVDAANYCLKRVPSNTLCLTNLAAAMGQMGSRDTSTVVAELLRASPNLTISEERARRVATNMSMQSIERFAEGLRKAGLPE